MRTRARNALALGVVVVALGGGLVWLAEHRDGGSGEATPAPRTSDVVEAIPEGAMLLVTADLGAVRKSEIGRPLLTRRRDIPGLGRVDDVCGFDPMDSLETLALAIPSGGVDGDFGLVAAGTIASEPLARCAAQVIAARGGQPVETSIGTFKTIRDVSLPQPGGEIAIRPGGPMLLGAGAYLRAMIDATEGRTPSVRDAPLHQRLREQLDGAAIVATFVFTPEQRRTIASELEGSPEPVPPLAEIAAIGASIAERGSSVMLRAIAVCETATACTTLESALKGALRERAADLGARIIGLSAPLERAAIEARGEELNLSVELTPGEADTLIGRLTEALESSPAPAASGGGH